MTVSTVTIKLPATYVHDWWQRCGEDMGVAEPRGKWGQRLYEVDLTTEALADLISDAKHYTSNVMRGEFIAEGSGHIVRSADATLRRLTKAGYVRG